MLTAGAGRAVVQAGSVRQVAQRLGVRSAVCAIGRVAQTGYNAFREPTPDSMTAADDRGPGHAAVHRPGGLDGPPPAVGAEGAQRILHAHRQLLREALASHGGREVKWLGDGLLTTFASVAEGCAAR